MCQEDCARISQLDSLNQVYVYKFALFNSENSKVELLNFKFAKHIMNVKKVRKNVHVLVENRMNIATSGHVHM